LKILDCEFWTKSLFYQNKKMFRTKNHDTYTAEQNKKL
jgi:hypothetical protein